MARIYLTFMQLFRPHRLFVDLLRISDNKHLFFYFKFRFVFFIKRQEYIQHIKKVKNGNDEN